ncbi:hypothetical protein GEMRC1_000861 [Eukaryota sp. GEM-RC1]
MNHSIRDPFSRLFDYIASFSKTCRRLSELDIPQKQLMLEFLKNLKPDSISSTLKKAVDFKQIHFLSTYSRNSSTLDCSSRTFLPT